MKGPKPHTKLVHVSGMPRNVMMRVPEDKSEESTPEPKPEIPEPPTWLDDDAKEIYRNKVGQIVVAGYWQERFEDSLALLVTLLAEHRRNQAGISAAKLTQLRLLLSELGLTPQSARGVTK